ncbi:spore gernimation protein GerQ, partial [Bacillus mojavensis]|nr:spore gernimation protein GerQ [Bacillus mojavensis]
CSHKKRSHKKHGRKFQHRKKDDYDSKKEFWKDGNCWVVKKKYK